MGEKSSEQNFVIRLRTKLQRMKIRPRVKTALRPSALRLAENGKKRPIHGKWGVFYPKTALWVKNAPFTVNRAFFTHFPPGGGRRAEGGFYPGPKNLKISDVLNE